MSHPLFGTIRKLASDKLIIHVRDTTQNDELIHYLSSLQEVETIILHSQCLKNLCQTVPPHAAYLFENEQLRLM